MYAVAPPYPLLGAEPSALAKHREEAASERRSRRARRRERVWPPVDVNRLRAELDAKLIDFRWLV